MQTFINLPDGLVTAIADILSFSSDREIQLHAKKLHDRYMDTDRNTKDPLIRSTKDMIAYLSLRFPSTYAQITGALMQIRERTPGWNPKTMLDLGCGPGTGIYAAKTVWPDIGSATAIDQERYFLTLGEELLHATHTEISAEWINTSIAAWTESDSDRPYDLVIVGNVLNELSLDTKSRLLDTLARGSYGVVLLLEPGTQHGFEIIQNSAEHVARTRPLLAPYIGNAFEKSRKYWIHFSQRYIRPEFTRKLRQDMKATPEKASDWEKTTYAYAAFGTVKSGTDPYAVCIGDVERYHGYLMVPLLTATGPEKIRVMKRQKHQYTYAKNLRWGETVPDTSYILSPQPDTTVV